jgi:ferritin
METLSKQLHTINEIQSAQQTDILFPNKLTPLAVQLLNQRLGDEYTAHYFYRNASNWCFDKAYMNAGAFFAAEAASELAHAEKIQDYLVGWNTVPFIPPVKMVPAFTTLIDIVNKAYVMEYDLFSAYNSNSSEIFNVCLATFDFLQELRIGQRQSVAEYSDLLNAAQLVNVSNNFEVLYYEGKYFKG